MWLAVFSAVLLFIALSSTARAQPPPTIASPTLASSATSAEVIPPTPAHYFNDYASLIDPKLADTLNLRLAAFEHQTTHQFLVVIFPRMQSSADLGDYCRRVFNAWGVGQKGVNNGVVLFVFVQDHKVRLSVGRGLETVLSDAASQQIIDQLVPCFRQGDFAGGITGAVDHVIRTLSPPQPAAPRSP